MRYHNKEVSLISYTGVIILSDSANIIKKEFEIIAHNRIMLYYRINDTPTFDLMGKSKRRRNQGIRKNFRYISQLFGQSGENITYETKHININLYLSDNTKCLIAKNQRSEIYIPIAWTENQKLMGGIYANIWNCDINEKTETVVSFKNLPVRSISTAICMFGNDLKGIDQYENTHSLTNPAYIIPDGICIEDIILESSELHLYEKQMYETYKNLVPFFRAVGNDKMPKFFFQIPMAEYVFYGLNMMFYSRMSMKAFNKYVSTVISRAKQHKEIVIKYCEQCSMEFDITGPMDILVFDKNGTFSLKKFLQKLNLNDFTQTKDNKYLISKIITRSIQWLSEKSNNPYYEIWQWIKQKRNNREIVEHEMHSRDSLLSLNYLSYTAKIATAKMLTTEGQLLLAHPYNEKHLALSYKSLFAGKCGGIIAFNWISPIFSNISTGNFEYYLDRNLPIVQNLINEGIIQICFIEAGSEVFISERNLPYTCKEKHKMLSKHII